MPSDEDYEAMANARNKGLSERKVCREDGCNNPKQYGNWTDYCREHTTQGRIKRGL